MLHENIAPLLAAAFTQLLGQPEKASMAFVRCLPAEIVRALAEDARFSPSGWRVAAVVDAVDDARRWMTADQAVEWREDKDEACLLLVDVNAAGAGMDGIYSAAREIGEAELFIEAMEIARQKLPHGFKSFARKAIDKARQISRHRHQAPWEAFSYLCRAVMRLDDLGGALPLIGLWPIAIDEKPVDTDLDKAARLAERMLPLHGARLSVEQRVNALRLGKAEEGAAKNLVKFLREMEGAPRLDVLAALEDKKDLWLNAINPGLFDDKSLQDIEWIDWRSKTKKPQTWSGLIASEGDRLELRLNPHSDNPKERARLEVRWTVEPEDLSKGAVDFVIEVRSGQDVLAQKTINHTGKLPQKAVFTQDDFEDLEGDSRFEAQVVIRTLGESKVEATSEDFVLCFGEMVKPTKSSTGKVFSSMSLAVAHVASSMEEFKRLACDPGNRNYFGKDEKGFITCRLEGKIGRVFCPPLLSKLSRDWFERGGALGRWKLTIRTDGTPVDEAEFIPMSDIPDSERLAEASKSMAAWIGKGQGPLGMIYPNEGVDIVNKYVLSAMESWKRCNPALTLVQTLEVVSINGQRCGLIVLPTHPLRVAWQQSLDLLVGYHRYEEALPVATIENLLEKVTGAHYPSFLPGFEAGQSFIFADTLGSHTVAMVHPEDPEPKATVALLGRLVSGDGSSEAMVGRGAANALSGEVSRYLRLHPEYARIKVHALRAGDAMSVVRALGIATPEAPEDDSSVPERNERKICYELDLFPANALASAQTGRFISATAERRRTGAGAVPERDRWMLESVTRPGNVSLPRLRWARRREQHPKTPAHLAMAFDVFSSTVEYCPQQMLASNGVLEAHGLMLMPNREFIAAGNTHWISYVPLSPDGEKHPVAGVLTRRQINLHTTILRATARNLGGGEDDWPILRTAVSSEHATLLHKLHTLCDWVITADRNAGIEYFDSPNELKSVYESYIIDSVPERDDMGFMQLITSTSSLDEVVNLLGDTLDEMGLSSSEENCQSLLEDLKAISGRLALRLAGSGSAAQEMIAIAMAHKHCHKAGVNDESWLSLKDGFFIPLDDAPDLFQGKSHEAEDSDQRADLLYVSAKKKDGLRFAFVEVKFRCFLAAARADNLMSMIERQVVSSCRRWDAMFGEKTSSLEKTVNGALLARVLRFYARKGLRHGLDKDAYTRINREIDRIVRKEAEFPLVSDIEMLGYVFCPDYDGLKPSSIEHAGEVGIWLFGPEVITEPPSGKRSQAQDFALSFPKIGMPESTQTETATEKGVGATANVTTDEAAGVIEPRGKEIDKHPFSMEEAESITNKAEYDSVKEDVALEHQKPEADDLEQHRPEQSLPAHHGLGQDAQVVLGLRENGEDAVIWHPSVKCNPNMMILGLPGMGKTTALINICDQLQENNITPIVFSYHQDIDEKLEIISAKTPNFVQYDGLGFNPMEVSGLSLTSYLDNVGMLRDIFAAIFPDLGDLQLAKLREALKTSYNDKGWSPRQRGEIPQFKAFLDILKADPKQDKSLLARLSELDDYGLFDNVSGSASLLDSSSTSIVQIHGTQNEYLQRAFATFVLYSLYQNMFKRGPQDRITHVIIFDEAHRAAKLKLIPTMVKECRKYGIAFVVASQEAKDFDPSLFTAIANYLALRLNESDAKVMAKMFASSDKVGLFTDKIKQMPKYKGMYYGEGMKSAVLTSLSEYK